MSAILIPSNFDNLIFELPAEKGAIELILPPVDCLKPQEQKEIIKRWTEAGVGPEDLAAVRIAIIFYNEKHKEEVEQLTFRQLRFINDKWNDSAQLDLGEQSASTEESSNVEA